MKVWRKQSVKWILKGKRVPAGTPKAKAKTIESKRYYGTLTLASGKRKQQPLTEERETSETLLRRLQTEEDSKRANGVDRYHDDRQKPIGEHLAAFSDYLTSRNNTPAHVTLKITRIRKLLEATSVKAIGDLDASRILKTLAVWRGRKVNSLSIQTSSHWVFRAKSNNREISALSDRRATSKNKTGRWINALTAR
jgi:hypothetical protein